MARQSNFGRFLTAVGSFAGGFTLGLLLSPDKGKETRKWISEHTTELFDWVDKKGKKAVIEGVKRITRMREDLQTGVKDHIPDLYRATEHIALDESDLIDG